MTDEIRLYAVPGDIVQLSGRIEQGKVLEWTAQLPIDRREFEKTHYAIGPIEADSTSRAEKFWPMNLVTMVKRVKILPRLDADDDPIRF